jgi:4-hydroxy-4-methyl-2-oxoglutarate aldolase
MTEVDLSALGSLTTAIVCDALVRLDRPIRIPPPELRPLAPGMRVAGAARPVRHYGSVDVFLEAIEVARPGDVLVIDNGNRDDAGCIGDLAALEARGPGLRASSCGGGTATVPSSGSSAGPCSAWVHMPSVRAR